MRIRESFVSNSSSSSYVIRMHKEKAKRCPTCGRGNDLDLLEVIRNGNHLDSKIAYEGKEGFLRELEFQIRRVEKDIKEYSSYEPNEVPSKFRGRGHTTTAKQLLEWSHEELKELRDRYDEFSAFGDDVVCVDIGYHDEIVRYAFEAGQKDGSIEVVSEGVY